MNLYIAADALGIEIEFKGKDIDEVGVVVSLSGELAPAVKIGQGATQN